MAKSYFTFRKADSSVRVDDATYKVLVTAAKHKLHGDIVSAEAGIFTTVGGEKRWLSTKAKALDRKFDKGEVSKQDYDAQKSLISNELKALDGRSDTDILTEGHSARKAFKIVSKKRGEIVRGSEELMRWLARDEESEPARREAFQAECRLREFARTRPDLLKYADETIAAFNQEAKAHPDVLEEVTDETHAKNVLQIIEDCLAAEAEARERTRKGFTIRMGAKS